MAKSWKKLVNSTDSDSNREAGGGNSLNDIQLTLDQIAAQNQELSNLLQERQSLENEMGHLLQSSNPAAEDPRFAGSIESIRERREKEKNRIAQKKKLEARILQKNKELEKWEQRQKRLKEKLALQKKLLQKKEANQDPSTSQKTRNKKDVFTERIKQAADISQKFKEKKAALDRFGQKDLDTFRSKTDSENRKKKPLEIPIRIQSIKDDWNKRRESKQEELKEKISLRKLSDKLQEMKRFAPLPDMDRQTTPEIPEFKDPKLRELSQNLEKALSPDDRRNKAAENASAKKAEQKEAEQKETERREKQKEGILSKKRAERKEEERSNRNKERKKEKYA